MPNPFADVSAPTALGVRLLGLSVTLLAVDIMGTIVLDRDRSGVSDRIATAIAQTQTVTQVPNAPALLRAPAVHGDTQRVLQARKIAPQPPPARANQPRVRQPALPAEHALAVHFDSAAPTAKRLALAPALLESVRAKPAPTSARQTSMSPPIGATPPSRQLVNLRDVRRFVMRILRNKDNRVCVISAMTFATDGGRVVVDLVYRDARGRWSEKAVVRRGTAALKLIGVKRRPLPYNALVATSVVSEP